MTDEESKENVPDKFNKKSDLVNNLFGIELESTFKNIETDAEPEKVVKEDVLKLSCHIDNNNNPINSL